METTKSNRTRKVTVRFSDPEFQTLQERWKKTTCRKLSDYVRKLLFGKPITTVTRNGSLDEIAKQLSGLKNELSRVGNNYNQVVQKMHTLKSISEFQSWLRVHETMLPIVFSQIKGIDVYIQKTGAQWLQ